MSDFGSDILAGSNPAGTIAQPLSMRPCNSLQMPKRVEECVRSVLDDNPEYSESRAYAICNAMQNRGELSVSDDPSHDELLTAVAQQEIDCPEGHVHTGSQCVPIEEVRDVPPSLLSADKELDEDPCWDGYTMVGTKVQDGEEVPRCVPSDEVPDANMAMADESDCPDGKVNVQGDCVSVDEVYGMELSAFDAPTVFQLAGLSTEPIERTEEGDSTVRYSNLSLLTEGVWTDQKSKTPTLYSEEGIANIQARYDESEFDGPPVNVMHDVDPADGEVHEASHGGYVDPNSLTFQNGALMGDIVLDTATAAGDFADENLQSALESNGRVGFGGPSVELDLDPEEHIQNSDHPSAKKEINGGWLTGLGLVMEPADKNVAFDRETRTRAVAMSSQTDKAVYAKQLSMDQKEEIRNAILSRELNLENVEEEVATIADEYENVTPDDVMQMLEPLMDMGGEGEEEEEMAEDSAVDVLEEQIDDLWDALDEMKAQMMAEEDLSESLAEAKEELADAETVAELEEAKEELDKRLSELEEEPKEPRSLSGDAKSDGSEESSGRSRMVASRDGFDGTIRR